MNDRTNDWAIDIEKKIVNVILSSSLIHETILGIYFRKYTGIKQVV